MKLREILPSDAEIEARYADLGVGGVTADSRAVRRGEVFVAIAGGKSDGLTRRASSLAAGAAAIVAEAAGPRFRWQERGLCRGSTTPAARSLVMAAQILPAPAAHRRRRHGRGKNVGRGLHAADLDRARTPCREHRHRRCRLSPRRHLRLADDA